METESKYQKFEYFDCLNCVCFSLSIVAVYDAYYHTLIIQLILNEQASGYGVVYTI